MQPLDVAVLRTLIYADVFDFAMTPAEIHRYLIHDRAVDFDSIAHTLAHSDMLKPYLLREGAWVALRPELFALRREREQFAARLWQQAEQWGARLASVPFVRAVGVTGALAVDNPTHPDDDLDYLLITQAGRVWLARALAIVWVRVGRLRGVEICPNFVLADDVLAQSRRDLYVAHEITQTVPLFGEALCAALYTQNAWLRAYLPNANARSRAVSVQARRPLKTLGEYLLRGRMGDALERWERERKRQRLLRQQTTTSAATLDPSQVKGHFNDHGARVLNVYRERLRAYGLTDVNSGEQAAD